jgi:hypothetical protein
MLKQRVSMKYFIIIIIIILYSDTINEIYSNF